MHELQNGMQIILQRESTRGSYECYGFTDVPVVSPYLITIIHAKSVEAEQWSAELRDALYLELLSLSETATKADVPCGGRVAGPDRCHAHEVDSCQKLLVIVGDSMTLLDGHPAIELWNNRGGSYNTLPVFQHGAPVAKLLPTHLQTQNAAFWHRSIGEVVNKVFATLGLTAHDARLFISYNREDAGDLAEQLFEELAKENFDVYVDRFRTPPGVDFKVRLEQELLDKAMVLVLESENIASSTWCQHEIAFATSRRLGILGLCLPKGSFLPNVPAHEVLSWQDFEDPVNPTVLTEPALRRVIERILQVHGQSLVRRRLYLRIVMRDALRWAYASGARLDGDGLMRVDSATKSYAIWLATRSLDVSDFQIADTSLSRGEKGVVIGPGAVDPVRQGRTGWLSDKSDILYFDEGHILHVAREIAGDRL